MIGQTDTSKNFLCKNINDNQYYAVKIINKMEVIRQNKLDKLLKE